MQTQQGTYDRKNTTRKVVRFFVFLGIVAGFWFLHSWLVANQASAGDQATAYLTLVIVLVTYLQWDVMAEQNVAIERQLDQVEFQQRAWLAAAANEIGPFVPEGSGNDSLNPDWSVTVRNTGSTPGIITGSKVEFAIRSIDEKIPDLSSTEYWAGREEPRRTVVPPGATLTFPNGNSPYVSTEDASAVRSGAKEAYLLAAFHYLDVFGDVHKTTCIFKYNKKARQLDNNHQNGKMT